MQDFPSILPPLKKDWHSEKKGDIIVRSELKALYVWRDNDARKRNFSLY